MHTHFLPHLVVIACLSASAVYASIASATDASRVQEIEYRVTLHPSESARAHLSVDLKEGAGRLATVRASYMGVQAQIENVRCDGTAVAETAKWRWAIPDSCRQLSWDVPLMRHAEQGTNASLQQSMYSDQGWLMISEITSILRFRDTQGHVTFDQGLQKGLVKENCSSQSDSYALPHPLSPPAVYIFGDMPCIRAQSGEKDFIYFLDDDRARAVQSLAAAHERGLSYLEKITDSPLRLPLKREAKVVIWLGLDKSHRMINGSAGSNAVLVNYVMDGSETIAPNDLNRSLYVLLHEHFHQLQPTIIFQGWVSEGLATYYGIKATQVALADATASTEALPLKLINPEAPVEMSLFEIQKLVNQGRRDLYAKFYSQGATFWAEVDRIIGESTNKQSSLDKVLPLILYEPWDREKAIPLRIRNLLTSFNPDKMDALISRYVETGKQPP